MPPKTAKEKAEAEIRRLSRLEGNRTCVDCNEKMPTYIDMTHKTFVCQKCSAIHRELQYKIKGISMTVFTMEDATEISKGGNASFNFKYMAKYSGKESLYASNTDPIKLKEFIHAKYVQKKWFSDDGTATESAATPTQSVKSSISASFRNLSVSSDNSRNSLNRTTSSLAAAPAVDLLNFGNDDAPPAYSNGFSGTSDPFHQSATQSQSFIHPQLTAQSSVNFDPFAPTPPPVSSTQSTTTTNGHFDPFGNNVNHQAPPAAVQQTQSFDPFGQSQQTSSAAASHNTVSHDPFAPSHSYPVAQQQQSYPQQNQYQTQPPPQHYNNDGFAPSMGQMSVAAASAPKPMMNLPFISLTPPAVPAPASAPAAPAVVEVKLPGFGAFDEIAPPVHTVNPFDAQRHAAAAQTGFVGGGYPAGQMPGGYPSHMMSGNTAGYPPQNYPPQAPGGYPSYPPASYPPHPYGQPQPPYGYPMPAGVGQPHGTVPPHQPYPMQAPVTVGTGGINAVSGNPFDMPSAAAGGNPPMQHSAPAPTHDTFSALSDMAWTNVSSSQQSTSHAAVPSSSHSITSNAMYSPQKPLTAATSGVYNGIDNNSLSNSNQMSNANYTNNPNPFGTPPPSPRQQQQQQQIPQQQTASNQYYQMPSPTTQQYQSPVNDPYYTGGSVAVAPTHSHYDPYTHQQSTTSVPQPATVPVASVNPFDLF